MLFFSLRLTGVLLEGSNDTPVEFPLIGLSVNFEFSLGVSTLVLPGTLTTTFLSSSAPRFRFTDAMSARLPEGLG